MSGDQICLAEISWHQPGPTEEMQTNPDFSRMSVVPSSAHALANYMPPSMATSVTYYGDEYSAYNTRCEDSYIQLKKLRNGHYKLKVAYFVLTLFVILSIATFILMNPVVSSFIWKNSYWEKCVHCDLLERCTDKQLVSTYQDPKNLDKCCFGTFEEVVKLITNCRKESNYSPGADDTEKKTS